MKKLCIHKAETLKTTDTTYVYSGCPWSCRSKLA